MKKLIFIFVMMCMFSCGDYIDKPKNLLDKKVMSEILADLALNNQAINMYPNKNLEAGTRFVLKAHNVKSEDFVDSFKYYVVKQKIDEIVDDAQLILLKKDPKAEKYIKEKMKNREGNQPILER
ncbi:MAG: DUF4296 domain-containing protein [Chryseobacterium sp.]|uniref:DUF4296 domain-containing protein n=1 Tax=Chryseobacterium sp. TaxID=1871047 RepID=UPI00281F26E0|nr:DUF4296 domain-containing protein [Chryseobacterium sp.]MDR2234543.1 DUF4296 domain-containing protein [Chryseobacterium sp.]